MAGSGVGTGSAGWGPAEPAPATAAAAVAAAVAVGSAVVIRAGATGLATARAVVPSHGGSDDGGVPG